MLYLITFKLIQTITILHANLNITTFYKITILKCAGANYAKYSDFSIISIHTYII